MLKVTVMLYSCCKLFIAEHEWFIWSAPSGSVQSLRLGWFACCRFSRHISSVLSPLQNGQAGRIGRTGQQLSDSGRVWGTFSVAVLVLVFFSAVCITVWCNCIMPSALLCCWLGGRKGILLVKNWVMRCWRGYLSGARRRLAYGPADATATHCLLLQ